MASESSEYFEYDEDLESSDEDFESDEDYESSDEDFESDEDVESSDEDFESDEDYESSDEDFESDESFSAEATENDESDEAYYRGQPAYSARIAARRAAVQRQRAWQRNVQATQAADARQALANQRNLSRRIQSATRTKTQAAPALKGSSAVSLQLPGRRPVRAFISPSMVSTAEMKKLRSVLARNDIRQAQAISKLSAAQAAAVKQLTAQQIKSDRDLGKKIVEGDNALNKLITKESADRKAAFDKHRKAVLGAVRRAEKRQFWNTALVGTSAWFWSLYADRSELFAKRNLMMAGSNAFWLFSDEIFGAVVGKKKVATQNLAWLAVAGNIATMMFIANNDQIERFVTVVDSLGNDGELELDSSKLGIAKDYQEDFDSLKEVRAVASYVTLPATGTPSPLQVSWVDKKLTISGGAASAGQKVAVLVDTWKNNGDL